MNYVLEDFGAVLRSMLEGRAERLGVELALRADQIASISEADGRLLAEIAEKLKAMAIDSIIVLDFARS